MEPGRPSIGWIPQDNQSAITSPSSGNQFRKQKKSKNPISSMESKAPHAANESPWGRVRAFFAASGGFIGDSRLMEFRL
jgi:hypothetical protein